MSSKAHVDRLGKALENTRLVQVVRSDFSHDSIRLLVRISPGADSAWTGVMENILRAQELIEEQAHVFQAHLCKNYFLKAFDDGRKLVFGWNVSIQSNLMTESLDVIVRAIKGNLPDVIQSKNDVMEMPLSTNAKELNAPNENGRGGWTVGGNTDFRIGKRG